MADVGPDGLKGWIMTDIMFVQVVRNLDNQIFGRLQCLKKALGNKNKSKYGLE